MSDDNLQLVQGAYEAFGHGDIPGVLAVMDENIVWHTPELLPQHVPVRGRDDVLGFIQKLGAVWEDFNLEIKDFCASGDLVCVIGRGGGKLDGSETGYGFVHVWTMRDGLCVHFDEYVDPSNEMVKRAAG